MALIEQVRFVLNWRDPRGGAGEQRFFEGQRDAQERRSELIAAYDRGSISVYSVMGTEEGDGRRSPRRITTSGRPPCRLPPTPVRQGGESRSHARAGLKPTAASRAAVKVATEEAGGRRRIQHGDRVEKLAPMDL